MRPRFSLRALLIAVTLIGVALAFVLWQKRIVEQRQDLLAYLLAHSGGYAAPATVVNNSVTFEHRGLVEVNEVTRSNFIDRAMDEKLIALHLQPNSNDPGLLRRWLGDKAIRAIWLPHDLPAADLAATVAAAFPEAQIRQLTSPPKRTNTVTGKSVWKLRTPLKPPPPKPAPTTSPN